MALLQTSHFQAQAVPSTSLSLDAPADSFQCFLCNKVRSVAGVLRSAWASWTSASGYLWYYGSSRNVKELDRSCVSVEILDKHHVEVMLGTRVHCKNLFGRFYMGAMALVHRRYVTPAMLRLAVEYALGQEQAASQAPQQLAKA